MDTTYKFSYPCKTISNFYDNFYMYNIYDEIKEVVYRKKQVLDVKSKEIFDYFLIFQLIYSLPINSTWEDYKNIYNRLFDTKISNDYEKTINQLQKDIYSGIFSFSKRKHNNLTETFLDYLYIQNLISNIAKHSVLLPANLISACNDIVDEQTGKYFVKGWFFMLYKPKKRDLKDRIIAKYAEEKEVLLTEEVNEVFLFGSVLKNEYHDSSDIDIVIKFKEEIEVESVMNIKKKYFEFNLKEFNRRTDIQDFYDYVEVHNINECLKIL